jgi:ComF family protein
LPKTHFHEVAENPVAQVFRGRLAVENATALFFFEKGEKVQRLLHNLKYNRATEAGHEAGRLLGMQIARAGWPVEVVVPVPLHAAKQRKRGYNQSAYLARGVADSLGVEYQADVLRRRRATLTQTRKSRIDRWLQLSEVFERVRPFPAERPTHYLLVDDIVTTGATLEACGLKLLEGPGNRLSIATLAIAT